MLFIKTESLRSLLCAPPRDMHFHASLCFEGQGTEDAAVLPWLPLLALPLDVDPVFLLRAELLGTVDTVPLGGHHLGEILGKRVVSFCMFPLNSHLVVSAGNILLLLLGGDDVEEGEEVVAALPVHLPGPQVDGQVPERVGQASGIKHRKRTKKNKM